MFIRAGWRRLGACILASVSSWRARRSASSFEGCADFGGLGLWPYPVRQVVLLEISIQAERNLSSLYNFTSCFSARIPFYWYDGIPFLSVVASLVYHVPAGVYSVTSCGPKKVFLFRVVWWRFVLGVVFFSFSNWPFLCNRPFLCNQRLVKNQIAKWNGYCLPCIFSNVTFLLSLSEYFYPWTV